MSEIERPKETAGELPLETPKAPEILKEPTIKKIYNIFGLTQYISLGIPILYGLFALVIIILTNLGHNSLIARDFRGFLLLISEFISFFDIVFTRFLVFFSILVYFLTSFLLFVIGIVLLGNRTNKIKKSYGKKFILRGIIVGLPFFLLLIYLILFSIGIILQSMMGIEPTPIKLNYYY